MNASTEDDLRPRSAVGASLPDLIQAHVAGRNGGDATEQLDRFKNGPREDRFDVYVAYLAFGEDDTDHVGHKRDRRRYVRSA